MRVLSTILSQVSKDLTIWFRHPLIILATVAPSIAYVFVIYFVSFTIGTVPVAVVAGGDGPAAKQMMDVLDDNDAFVVRELSPDRAQAALHHLDVAAIITIPPDFDQSLAARRPTELAMTVNNVNADEADDLRRALPAAITDYYEKTPHNPVRLHMDEHDTHAQDFTLGQFEFIPIVVFVMTIAGIVCAGYMACYEWQSGTVHELLLAPAPRWAIVAAKITSGWAITMALAAIVLATGTIAGFLRVTAEQAAPCAVVLLLLGLASASVGTMLGMAFGRMGMVHAVGVQLAFNMFFLTGGISVLAFLPEPIQRIAPYVPTYYAVHALDREILYGSGAFVARDIAVLACIAAATVLATAAVFRRRAL